MAGMLDGKVAVVTGAARGIGRATLEVFLEEGARVVATDIDGDGLAATVGSTGYDADRVVTVTGDVSVEADADAMIAKATETWGRLDCLVANAGVIPLSTIDETSVEDWDHVMAVDGRGMFLTCRAAIRVMADQGSGSIVCLSSISGMAGQASQAAYGPAKFVATGLTKHLAVEWAARGIRVNAVAPGTIRTDAVDGAARERVGTGVRRPDGGPAPDGPARGAARGGAGHRLPRLRPGQLRDRRGARGRRRLPGSVAPPTQREHSRDDDGVREQHPCQRRRSGHGQVSPRWPAHSTPARVAAAATRSAISGRSGTANDT